MNPKITVAPDFRGSPRSGANRRGAAISRQAVLNDGLATVDSQCRGMA